MSTSTDGILLYGMIIRDGEPFDSGNEDPSEKLEEAGFRARVGYHCSDSYPMAYLAVGDGFSFKKEHSHSVITAWRGNPQKVDMIIDPSWDEELKKAADFINWPEDAREIGWWLASYWG